MLTRANFESVARSLCAAEGIDPDELVPDGTRAKLHNVLNRDAYVVEFGPKMARWMFKADVLLGFATTQQG